MASRLQGSLAPVLRRALRRHSSPSFCSRYYASNSTPSSSKLLAQGLDRAAGRDAPNSGAPGSVGPFPLGVSPLRSSRQAPEKPWAELTPSGKVIRTTQRASNLTVILVGATLSVVLTYALATELFAKNSPTVLYSDACDRIKGSEAVKEYLPGTLSFHTTPPSLVPTRHRNRHPQATLAIDSNGVEHMLIHFWVTSSHITDAQKPQQSWVEWAQDEWDLDWSWERIQDSGQYLKGKAVDLWDETKRTVAYVSGLPIPTTGAQPSAMPTVSKREPFDVERNRDSSNWGLFGLFKNLKGTSGSSSSSHGTGSLKTQWDSAEVHVDMVKDAAGNFRYRYLLADLPNSRVRYPQRIVVERGPGFNDREGIFVWQ